MRRDIIRAIHYILDCIFPVFCVRCDLEGSLLCDDCFTTLDVSGVFCCPVCHAPQVGGSPCASCQSLTPLASHVAMIPLTENSLIHTLIHLYKYEYLENLEDVFERLIVQFLRRYPLSSIEYIVPVPLHRKRFVERGFNQSERIAGLISRVSGVPSIDALTRVVPTVQQATLDKAHRIANVQGAFAVKKEYHERVRGKGILLVDDVYTTGSTLSACAHALERASVARVSGWSIARG
jgi:competence protein ComFC